MDATLGCLGELRYEELRRLDPNLPPYAEPKRDLHSGLDGAPADLAVSLCSMTVARGEQCALDADREEKGGSGGEMADVDVPAESRRWDDRVRSRALRCDADRARERPAGQLETVAEEDAPTLDSRDPEPGLWEVVGEEPEPRDDRCPSPRTRPHLEHLDLEHVARSRSADEYRTGDGVHQVEVDGGEVVDHGALPDLVARGVRDVELHHVTGVHLERRFEVTIPGAVERRAHMTPLPWLPGVAHQRPRYARLRSSLARSASALSARAITPVWRT